jgi:hypothetical protein
MDPLGDVRGATSPHAVEAHRGISDLHGETALDALRAFHPASLTLEARASAAEQTP